MFFVFSKIKISLYIYIWTETILKRMEVSVKNDKIVLFVVHSNEIRTV